MEFAVSTDRVCRVFTGPYARRRVLKARGRQPMRPAGIRRGRGGTTSQESVVLPQITQVFQRIRHERLALYAGDIARVGLNETSTSFAAAGLHQTQPAQFGKRGAECQGGNAHSGGKIAFTRKLGTIFKDAEFDCVPEPPADFLSTVCGFQWGESELLFPSLHRLLLGK
jgi:hypothetical protein